MIDSEDCTGSAGLVEESGVTLVFSSFSFATSFDDSFLSSLFRTSCSKKFLSFLFLLAFFIAANLRRNLSAGESFFIFTQTNFLLKWKTDFSFTANPSTYWKTLDLENL